MMNLRHLGHVLALADERHFARAAERVHLSQPAFSRSIQAIEQDLGMRLFERDSGNIRPTPAGEFLIARARRLLADARGLSRDVDLYRDSQLGDTAFGVGPFPAATLMPLVLLELRRLHPRVCLRVEASNWQQLQARLEAEDIEFFVADVRDLPANPDAAIQSLGRQPGHFYVRQGHPLLAQQRCTLAEIWTCGVAATKLPRGVKAALGRLLGMPAGSEPGLALECDDVAILRAVALATDTVLAATDAAVRADAASGQLVALDVEGLPLLFSEMGIVSLRNRTPSPMARKAMECIQQVAGGINT